MRRGLLLIFACLLWPVLAHAAPNAIPLAEYQGLLRQAVRHLDEALVTGPAHPEQADAELAAAFGYLNTAWVVQGSLGEAVADLRPIANLIKAADAGAPSGRDRIAAAVKLLRDHLAASDRFAADKYQIQPEARERLERNLNQALRTGPGWWQRLLNWIKRVVQGFKSLNRIPADDPASIGGRRWASVGLGLAGLVLLTWGLMRIIAGRSRREEGPLDLAAPSGNSPETPGEMKRRAHHLADSGREKEGLRLLHLALLHRFDRRGILQFRSTETNREHEEQVRLRFPYLASQLRLLHLWIETLLYGERSPARTDFDRGSDLVEKLWREGDAASPTETATHGASSSVQSG